jgi:predicted permease
MVLVVACTNLANLVLARGTARQGELAIRMAMGASRARLIWEQCIESLLLSVFGAVAAYAVFIIVSAMMTQDFAIIIPPMGRLTLSIRPELNPAALSVAAISMLLALVVFGLEPAVHLARAVDIRGALATGATGIRPRVGRQRIIIRWQVAVAAGFFIVATMFIRATFEQARHDAGVEIDRIAVAQLNFSAPGWDEMRIRRTIDRIVDEGRRETAIESVAASTGLPFGVQPSIALAIARPDDDVQGAANRSYFPAIAGTSALFRTLGIQIVSGRGFNDGDTAAAPPVIIVSEQTARQLFGSAAAVGQTLVVKPNGGRQQRVTVIGVTRDTDVRRLGGARGPLVFLPWQQSFNRNVVISMRSTGDGRAAVATLRESIRRADLDAGVDVIGSGRSVLSGPFEIVRAGGRGALYLGAFTLLLSMVGLFGVQSHIVTYRTREFGVRMSLGATAGQIKVMVVRDGYRPIVEGLVLGLWGGVAARAIVRSYTDIDVAIFDASMLLVAPIPVILSAIAACYLPAARASRVDPVTALRCE